MRRDQPKVMGMNGGNDWGLKCRSILKQD